MAALPPALTALRHRDFRWLWSGTFCSTASQWIQQATLGWVVYDLTGSPALLGAVLGVRAIPMLLLAPISGLVADRVERRRALAISQIVPAVVSFALALALALDALLVWHLFAFSLAVGSGTVFERTLRNTLVFDVVPRAEAANAVALNNVAFSTTRAIGPAIAGVLIAWIGPAWNFALQGVAYVGVAASVLMVTVRPRRTGPPKGSAWRAMAGGIRFAATDPIARMMMILGLVPPLMLIPSFSALMPVFAADILQTGPEGLGLLLSAVGAGGIVGGVVAAALSRYDRIGALQTVSLVVFAGSLIGFALSPTMAWAIGFLAISGIAEMVFATSAHTTLQMSAPEAIRGQVTSLLPMFPAFISVGSFTSGLGAALIGPQAVVVVLALVAAAIALAAWLRSTAFRDLRMSQMITRGGG